MWVQNAEPIIYGFSVSDGRRQIDNADAVFCLPSSVFRRLSSVL